MTTSTLGGDGNVRNIHFVLGLKGKERSLAGPFSGANACLAGDVEYTVDPVHDRRKVPPSEVPVSKNLTAL